MPLQSRISREVAWEPDTMQAKGNAVRYWIVENNKRTSDYCKDQLVVWKNNLKTQSLIEGTSKCRWGMFQMGVWN